MDSSGVRPTDTLPDRQPPSAGARSAASVTAGRPLPADGHPPTGVAPVPPGAPRVAPATPREDVVLALLGACLVGGILADSWAHVNLSETLEGFFTPWHGLLYAGFVGTAAWTFWLAYQRRGTAPRWWRDGWPAGYGIGAIGVLVFLAGGLGDMVWHEVLGVEVALNAAFSPSHLLIDVGAVVLLTSPLRSMWSATGTHRARTMAGVGSVALAVAATAPLLSHSLALTTAAPTLAYDPSTGRGAEFFQAVATVDGYLVTTLILTIPLLLVHRRRPVPGIATALVGGITLFVSVMFWFPNPQITAGLTAVCAAVLVDVALVWLDGRRGPDAPMRLPIAGALFPAVLWTGHLLGLHLAAGVRWPAEMWTGTVVLTALLGALMGTLAARPAARLP